MITHLDGTLAEKDLTRAVIDVRGVGYELLIPMSSYDRLPRTGERVMIRTHLHVREDALQLYGFVTEEERALFRLLINSVAGIGPKLGLNILSSMPVSAFCAAVAQGNVRQLTQINGIGKRSAERLVIELKDRVLELAPGAGPAAGADDQALSKTVEDAVGGLVTLGFKQEAARRTVNRLATELPSDGLTAETLIRQALTQLNR